MIYIRVFGYLHIHVPTTYLRCCWNKNPSTTMAGLICAAFRSSHLPYIFMYLMSLRLKTNFTKCTCNFETSLASYDNYELVSESLKWPCRKIPYIYYVRRTHTHVPTRICICMCLFRYIKDENTRSKLDLRWLKIKNKKKKKKRADETRN